MKNILIKCTQMENAQNILANKNQVFEWSIILWSRSFSIIYKESLLLKVSLQSILMVDAREASRNFAAYFCRVRPLIFWTYAAYFVDFPRVFWGLTPRKIKTVYLARLGDKILYIGKLILPNKRICKNRKKIDIQSLNNVK